MDATTYASRSRAATLNLTMFIVSVVGLLSVVLWDEYAGWVSTVAHIEHELLQDSRAIAQHVDDTLQVAELALSDLTTELHDEVGSTALHDKLVNVMKGQVASARRIDSLSFIGPDGRLVATSVSGAPKEVSFTDRAYFKYHESNSSSVPYIGPPVVDRLRGGWIITISRRYENHDGSFGGIVIATVSLRYFADFFRNFDVGDDGAFLLVRSDGMVLTRLPLQEDLLGKDISSHDLFQLYLRQGSTGVYHYRSPVDTVERISAFVKSPTSGIVVQTAASRAETLSDWINSAQIRWPTFLAMLVLASVAGWRWSIQAKLRRKSQRDLRRREEELRLIAENSADLIQRLSLGGTREYVSPASLALYGIAPEDLKGKNMLEGLDEDSASSVRWALERMASGVRSEKITARRRLPDGRTIWVETTFSRCEPHPEAPASIVAVTRDITREKEERDRLDTLARTDALTGLANRRALDERLAEFASTTSLAAPVSFLLIDADNFKKFNDTYGHEAGDACLKAMAQALQGAACRQGDLAARYGGEELALLLPGADADGAALVAENVRRAVENLNIDHIGNALHGSVTVSIGVSTAVAGSNGASVSSVLMEADQALYMAKNAGRNRVCTVPSETRWTLRSARRWSR
ncbi:diguanylate cyclase [Rhizobium sp. XQZ8]|uniref:diguanylate cyclase n=1 Tax=Rhizobium populisoli TaxID=2859785 RepID=UPI001CA4C842|nr:diguanylate cyclase [Rhizobium populisoli]MBW6424317.1 diguanylate cyclase [Rhizobium populisoli]